MQKLTLLVLALVVVFASSQAYAISFNDILSDISHFFGGDSLITGYVVANPTLALDADGNGNSDALSDGVLISRYLFGFSGTTLTNGAIGSGATRTTSSDIITYLNCVKNLGLLDADGNGNSDALSDGVLISRYLFGFSGTTLTNGAVGTDATRTTSDQIITFLNNAVANCRQTTTSMTSSTTTSITTSILPTSTTSTILVTTTTMTTSTVIPQPSLALDADGNGNSDALSDGVLISRYLFGFSGTTLTNGAIGSGATRANSSDIITYLDCVKNLGILDADGNGNSDALSDGVLISRYLFGFSGTTLTNGAIGSGATRANSSDIIKFLNNPDEWTNGLCGSMTTSITTTTVLEEAYFKFTDDVVGDTFIFKLTNSSKIQKARNILNGVEVGATHVSGTVIKSTAAYNPSWSYYLDPNSIIFFEYSMEVCDSSIRYVEDNLADVGGAFLPNNMWCPWRSRLVAEVTTTTIDITTSTIITTTIISNVNEKDMTKYTDKELFLVSDIDWKDVLPFVSAAVWTGNESCQKGYGTPDDVCVYPFLIYHDDIINDVTISPNNFHVFIDADLMDMSSFSKTLSFNSNILNLHDNLTLTVFLENTASIKKRLNGLKLLSYPSFLTNTTQNPIEINNDFAPGETRTYQFNFTYLGTPRSFDIDSSIYFMQQYSPGRVTIIGQTPQELDNLLIAAPELGAGLRQNQIQRISQNDYLSYWQSYKDVIYVEDNYELALLASTYASLINVPLIIQGTNSDTQTVFSGKNVICVGNVAPTGASCGETYTLEQLQQKYVQETQTDKIILVNPSDLNMNASERFQPEKSSNPIYELYSKTSLAAPILASAKKEIIIPIDSSSPVEIKTILQTTINSIGLNLASNIPTKYEKPDLYILNYYSFDTRSQEKLFNSTFDIYPFDKTHSDEIYFMNPRNAQVNLQVSDKTNLCFSINMTTKEVFLKAESMSRFNFCGHGVLVYYNGSDQKTYFKNSDNGESAILSGLTQNIMMMHNIIYFTGGSAAANTGIYQYNLSDNKISLILPLNYTPSGMDVSPEGISWVSPFETAMDGQEIMFYDLKNNSLIKVLDKQENNVIPYFQVKNNKIIFKSLNFRTQTSALLIYDIGNGSLKSINSSIIPSSNELFLKDDDFYIWDYSADHTLRLYKLNINTEVTELLFAIQNINIPYSPLFNERGVFWTKEVFSNNRIVGYLTIMSHPLKTPIREKVLVGAISYRGWDSIYSDINNDFYPDLAWGRIVGLTISDVSSYIGRSIFFNALDNNNNISVIQSSPDLGGYPILADNLASKFSQEGYNVEIAKESQSSYPFDNSYWLNKKLVYYIDHGNSDWAGVLGTNLPEQDRTIILNDACSTCSTYDISSFCMNVVRKGAVAHIGALDVVKKFYSDIEDFNDGYYLYTDILNGLFYDRLDLGMAYATSESISYLQLFGDPTLKLDIDYYFNDELVDPQ